jgi:hypothetical protein
VLAVLAVVAGAAIWTLVARAGGRREAWDSELYFSAGIPALCLVAALCAFLEPARPWRWGVLPLAGQCAWMFLSQGLGNLWPLGIVASAFLSIPPVLAAVLAAAAARRWRRPAA